MTHCSFCGRDETEAEVIVTGPKGAICGECVDLAMKKVTEYRQRPRPHLFPGEVRAEFNIKREAR